MASPRGLALRTEPSRTDCLTFRSKARLVPGESVNDGLMNQTPHGWEKVAPLENDPPITMPNLSQGRAPPIAIILEPKNPEPGSASEKGESYGHVRRGRQKQKHNHRHSSGGGNPRDHLPLYSGPFVRNSLRRGTT